ncbi:MAG: polysaccharide biosynthesis/export family protein [Hyphomicrobiaceae bacterium]|nr:polysaccharide biosynthesis/export family protein [Hyphomicrobiaceae bacterium]
MFLLLVFPAQAGGPTDLGTYKISAGDRVAVTVFGQPDLSGDFAVDGAGQILLPLLGLVPVVDMTAAQIQEKVVQLLADGILRQPAVSVRIAEVRPLNVLGDVRTPGVFPYRFGSIVKNAIAQAGGYGMGEAMPGSAASELLQAEERIRVLRAERTRLRLKESRLEAQRDGRKEFEPRLTADDLEDPGAQLLVEQEKHALTVETTALDQQIESIASQRPQFLSERDALQGQIDSENKQLELVQSQMTGYEKLVSKGLGRSASMVELQIGEAGKRTNIYRLMADQSRLRNQLVALDIQMADVTSKYKQRVQSDLQTVQQRLHDLETTIPQAKKIRDLKAKLAGRHFDGFLRTISITRMKDGVASVFEAADTAFLEPGDIIEVRTTETDLRSTAALNTVGAKGAVANDREAAAHARKAP